MVAAPVRDEVGRVVREALELEERGELRAAIDLLTAANRASRSPRFERALVRIRRSGCRWLPPPDPSLPRHPVVSDGSSGGLFEVSAAELDLASLRTGLAQSGCVLVRGLVPAARVERLVAGIDAALDAYDASERGEEVADPGLYSYFQMPDRVSPLASQAVVTPEGAFQPAPMPERRRRKFIRDSGGLWTACSPHMLYELFELVDDSGIGRLMTEHLGERPLLSANKCTLRRVPPETVTGGWHQDGAFLGDHAGSFNFWLSLSHCGRDAPGLDILPKRIDGLLKTGDGAQFEWSLSDEVVHDAAEGVGIVCPEFGPGDALLFDHRLVHRTAASSDMTRERHAIESWFFAPSAYPGGQLPLVY